MKSLLAALVALTLTAGSVLAAKIDITINKASQKMTVKVDGKTEYVWPVSTGAPGYATPSGTYRPFRMEAEHYSKEWDDAPMPHSVFFTTRGHAIHGSYHTKKLGRPVSHGCVRLAPSNAKILFGLIKKNGMKNTSISVRRGFTFGNDFAFENAPAKKRRAGRNVLDVIFQ